VRETEGAVADYGVEGTERICLPMESPLGSTRSIVGGESIPRIFPGLDIRLNWKGGDNEENT